jgi:hypothetical protein
MQRSTRAFPQDRLCRAAPLRDMEHSSERTARSRVCLVATATVLELAPMASSQPATSCLCTGRHASLVRADRLSH